MQDGLYDVELHFSVPTDYRDWTWRDPGLGEAIALVEGQYVSIDHGAPPEGTETGRGVWYANKVTVPEVRVTDGELDLGFAGNLWVAAFSAIPRIVTDDTLIGDANVDGYVDFVDFLAMSSHFGQAGSWFEGDFNEDEVIDFEDFLLLAKSFGQSTS